MPPRTDSPWFARREDENAWRSKENARKIKEVEKELAKVKKEEERTRKKTKALAVFNSMFVDVTKKAQDLRAAALRVGKAYSEAATRHRNAVAKQNQVIALETHLMFSALSILTSGALSWSTEMVKGMGAIQAISRAKELDRMVNHAKQYSAWGTAAALEYQAQSMKALLAKQVSNRDLFINVTKDTVTTGLGAVYSNLPSLYSPPAPSEPASMEPLEYQDALVAQVDNVEAPALDFLQKLANKIKDLPDEAWDNYDDSEFQTVYRKWVGEANKLGGVAELPSEKTMTDDLERYIWAVWMSALTPRTVQGVACASGGGEAVCNEYDSVEWVRVRKPIDDRFVALRIETEEETNQSREEEDKQLLYWSKNYLRGMKPWISGKAKS